MTTAKADKGISEARPYAYAGGTARRNQRFHITPASEIRAAFIAIGWVGELRADPRPYDWTKHETW